MKFDLKSLLPNYIIGKRQQIDSAQKQVMMWLSFAGCAVVVTLIVGCNFWNKIVYQTKVNTEVGNTESILKGNVEKIKKIKSNVDALKADEALNLSQIKPDDRSPLQVILDALPTKNDTTSLGSSLQDKILTRSGVVVQAINIDSNDTELSSTKPNTKKKFSSFSNERTLGLAAIPVHFSVTISGSIHYIQKTINDLNNSIRTIVINDIQIDGSDDRMTAHINATTYYAPKIDYKLMQKEVAP